MKLAVIGTGYVGLVSGVCFASLGHEVTCIDKQETKIAQLKRGTCPIYEPGLAELMGSAAARLAYTTDLTSAVATADIIMVAVGTPPDPEDGKADLSQVFDTARELAPLLSNNTAKVIIIKSTVPVGTGKKFAEIIRVANPDAKFEMASNPEFLREGSAIDDFMKPDRIVVGVASQQAGHALADLYRPLTNAGYPLLQTDVETAEMIKYASNSFLATKIAFINEMADICEKVGANVEQVAKGMGMDSRIGEKFLKPGPGFGGSCFPKDAIALAQLASEAGVDPRIVNTVIDYNLSRRESMADRVLTACANQVKHKKIALLGLTFKANTDDMRESPSIPLVGTLLEHGASICAYDPEGMPNARLIFENQIEYAQDAISALTGADVAVIVTEWQEFINLDLEKARGVMKSPTIVDLRNIFLPDQMAAKGFAYYSIGRKPVIAPSASARRRAT